MTTDQQIFFYKQLLLDIEYAGGIFMDKNEQLIVYTLEFCPNCELLKEYLTRRGIPYLVRDLSTAESMTELRVNGVFVNEAPVLQKDEEFLTSEELFSSGAVQEEEVQKLIEGA